MIFQQQNIKILSIFRWSLETKKWTYVTPMTYARDGCHAVVLNDEIFVIGGFDKVALTVTEAYSPATGKWRQCASMVHGRMYYGVIFPFISYFI